MLFWGCSSPHFHGPNTECVLPFPHLRCGLSAPVHTPVPGSSSCPLSSRCPSDPRLGTLVTFLTSTLSCSVQAPGRATPAPGRVQPLRASDASACQASPLTCRAPPAPIEALRVMLSPRSIGLRSLCFSLPGHLAPGIPGLETESICSTRDITTPSGPPRARALKFGELSSWVCVEPCFISQLGWAWTCHSWEGFPCNPQDARA